ncbi:unnamed protein product [Vicia faba]|uniref:Transmembrane protein n=1 Tax=Vicia faba TaxID=3906 RepID=A0AAV1B8E0_VICFA|nr:unnamed protein product [Vicia faba]
MFRYLKGRKTLTLNNLKVYVCVPTSKPNLLEPFSVISFISTTISVSCFYFHLCLQNEVSFLLSSSSKSIPCTHAHNTIFTPTPKQKPKTNQTKITSPQKHTFFFIFSIFFTLTIQFHCATGFNFPNWETKIKIENFSIQNS